MFGGADWQSQRKLLSFSRLGWIEAELRSSSLRVRFSLAPGLLVWRFERPQPADFFENTLGVQLVLQAL